FLAMLA
ncbi:hypothetical protein MKD33_00975, partial [Chromobacterium piscinae]